MALNKALLNELIELSQQAGEAILKVYHQVEEIEITTKADDSPVTAADLAAHAIIEPGLASLLDGVPILSEESTLPAWDVRRNWQRYWIVDPLDGTKEFIKRSGEFTVNIALIDNGVPVLGVVYVPVSGVTYAGIAGQGAWKYEDGTETAIQTRSVAARKSSGLPIEVVASRNHGAEEVSALMDRVGAELGEVATKNMGSSLKLCLVAEGEADLYPRLALTSEWDTAAAQAVVEAAGGKVIDADFNILRYNSKENILNPFFHVIGDPSFDWERLL